MLICNQNLGFKREIVLRNFENKITHNLHERMIKEVVKFKIYRCHLMSVNDSLKINQSKVISIHNRLHIPNK